MPLTFGSLFAGIGGFDLGFERAGMECKWQVEIDDYCQRVLAKHWPEVKRHGDIRTVGQHNLEAVDVICGGFPCQPFSVAGKREGEADDRHLWPEMLRVIAELKPTWVVGENVPGIINIFLDQALSDLEDEGYTCETFVLPACAFDAPHRRDRLFILATNADQSASTEQRSEHQVSEKSIGRSADVADTSSRRREQRNPKERGLSIPDQDGNGTGIKTVADTKRRGTWGRSCGWNGALANAERHYKRRRGNSPDGGWERWSVEPGVGRVVDGVSNRVDRLKSLGNAVVPQVAEWIGRMIVEADAICHAPGE